MISKKLESVAPVIHGDYTLTGRGFKVVRLTHPKAPDIGFATTTYSHCMSDDLKAYSAARIALAMQVVKGLSNSDLETLIQRKKFNTA